MVIYLSLLVAIIGGLVFMLSAAGSKWEKLGIVTYGCGLLAFLLRVVSGAFTVIK